MLPDAPFNETHWPDGESQGRYIGLYQQAKATSDAALRKELVGEMQKIEWDRGGYIIWGYNNFIDAVSDKVSGIESTAQSQLPLDTFGFKNAQLAA